MVTMHDLIKFTRELGKEGKVTKDVTISTYWETIIQSHLMDEIKSKPDKVDIVEYLQKLPKETVLATPAEEHFMEFISWAKSSGSKVPYPVP